MTDDYNRNDDRGPPDDGRRPRGDLAHLVASIAESIGQVELTATDLDPETIAETALRPGGGIETLHAGPKATMVREASIDELLPAAAGRRVVGVDAGLIRPLTVRTPAGGLLVAFGRAAAGASYRSPDLERLRTYAGVVVDHSDRIDMSDAVYRHGPVESHRRRIVAADTQRADNPVPLATDYLRALVEGRHLRRVAQTAGDVPIAIDGPILPSATVLRDYLFERRRTEDGDRSTSTGGVPDSTAAPEAERSGGARPDGGTRHHPDGDGGDDGGAPGPGGGLRDRVRSKRCWRTEAGRVLAAYLEVADRAIGSQTPLFGVVKRGRTSQFLGAAEATLAGSPESGWHRDRDLFGHLLSGDGDADGCLRFTPWIEARGYRDPTADAGNDRRVELLRPQDDPVHDPRDYHRCWMYVTTPEGGLLRLETLRGLVSAPAAAAQVRSVALGTIARSASGGVPPVVAAADERASISRSDGRQLLEECGLGLTTEYDRDIRGLSGAPGGDGQ